MLQLQLTVRTEARLCCVPRHKSATSSGFMFQLCSTARTGRSKRSASEPASRTGCQHLIYHLTVIIMAMIGPPTPAAQPDCLAVPKGIRTLDKENGEDAASLAKAPSKVLDYESI